MPRRFSAIRLATAGAAALALVAVGAAPAHALTDDYVESSDIDEVFPAAGVSDWTITSVSSGGSAAITDEAFDGRDTLTLTRDATSDQVTVMKTWGVGVRPTSIPELLDGASYSYTGANPSFQLGLFYTPTDLAAYGPSGTTSACMQALDTDELGNRPEVTDHCFTVIKFEPGSSHTDEYRTVFFEGRDAGYHDSADGGWWNTQQVGQYAKNSQDVALSEFLAEMESYVIYGVGVSIGSGGEPNTSFVLDMTFGGELYRFGDAPSAESAGDPPAADSAGLEGLSLEDDSEQFESTDSQDLGSIDPNQGLNGTFGPWQNPTDAFVDAFTFSSAVHVGTFPIVNGQVQLSGVELSHLGAGPHSLLLQGQTSGDLRLVEFDVAEVLAETGGELDPAVIAGAVLALALGVIALLVARARRETDDRRA